MLRLSDIVRIARNLENGGYDIVCEDGRVIRIHKKRTIPALLTLIHHGEGCESDLTTASTNLKDIKALLKGKISDDLILDSYSDANKPFSELWNEEGFRFIYNPPGAKRRGSQKYVLDASDHDKLFSASKKARRALPTKQHQTRILALQKGSCNICGATVSQGKDIQPHAFSRDRRRLVWDHRVPVEKGGSSDDKNYQGLCFYCNKSKWQVCNICPLAAKDCRTCVLAFPEKTAKVKPTGENISDRMKHHR